MDTLVSVVKTLKPGGVLYIREPVALQDGQAVRTADKLVSTLKFSGLVNVSQVSGGKGQQYADIKDSKLAFTQCHLTFQLKTVSLGNEELDLLKKHLKCDQITGVVEATGSKPSYEAGAQVPLPWAKPQGSIHE